MKKYLWGGVLLIVLMLGVLWWRGAGDRESGTAPPPTTPESPEPIQRGRELVALADCRSCHTARGGAPFAGGRAIYGFRQDVMGKL